MASEDKNSFAKVPGVLKVNEDTREEMMRRIYWKDRQYLQYGSGLAEYVDIKDRSVSPMTGGKSLVDFTHDGKTDYSEDINRKYKLLEKEAYEVKPLGGDLQMWEGDYLVNFTERNKLSEVGDLMYAQGMTFANYANSDRHVKEKYLTPDLTAFYGTSPIAEGDIRRFSIFAKGGLKDAYNNLSGEYKRASGRIPDIAEAQGASIVHDYVTGEPNENNGGNYFLEEQLSKSIGYKPDKIGGRMRYADLEMSQPVGELEEYYGRKYEEGNSNSADEPHEYHEYDKENIGDETRIEGFETNFTGTDLLSKTNDLFRAHRISTLMGRFHTSVGENGITDAKEITDTAKSSMYGNSHGRNLLKLEPDKPNGYDNPYCRVWTYHHQYDRVSKMIRPFVNEKGAETVKNIQAINKSIRAHSSYDANTDTLDGGKYLADNTVLSNSGFVNIVPSNDVNNPVDIKKCMFSIENLAWKDVLKKDKEEYNLSKEQCGPNGGRIMWFPPYDLDFQENVTVDWDQNEFIGRGEKVYTYKNTTRTGTLSFTLLIDHPGVIDVIKNKTKYGDDKEDYQAILRYFAGCDTLEDWVDEEKEVEDIEEKDNNNDEGKQVPSEETSKTIKFYVYYPNNYSGNNTVITEPEWNKKGYSDPDWYYYLLTGRGTTNSTNEVEWRGYEMSTQGGLGNADSGTEIKPNPTVDCAQWQDRETTTTKGPFQYRVDFDLRQELKYGIQNYKDSESFNLNGTLDTSVSVGATHSFAEVMCALLSLPNKGNAEYKLDRIIEKFGINEEKIKELVKIFSGSTIYKVTAKGAATKQDSSQRKGCKITNSELLANRRSKTICRTIKDFLGNDKIDFSDGEKEEVPQMKDYTTVNSKEAKSQRYAVVEIKYNAAEITKASEANNNDNNGNSSNITSNQEYKNDAIDLNNPNSKTLADIEREKKGTPEKEKTAMLKTIKYSELRYETEADYFDKLSTTDPFTFENLKKRFKYFTPAFHSISPEGFNARLTFLQQCTRQGHTIESSASVNGYRKTAGNLAFGRMPVCVLRLGDFINTRILINNLTINYQKEGMQWDLNPEGAGVQPMFATVSMGITILGGQSLTGPISRLQNAVSFNYYANTGVYDNRADRVEIEDNGKETYKHLWTPKVENPK